MGVTVLPFEAISNRLFQQQRRFQNRVHMLRRDKVQGLSHRLVNFLQIPQIGLGNDHRLDAMAQGRHGLLLEAADCHHPAANGDLAGHGDIPANRRTGQRRHQAPCKW